GGGRSLVGSHYSGQRSGCCFFYLVLILLFRWTLSPAGRAALAADPGSGDACPAGAASAAASRRCAGDVRRSHLRRGFFAASSTLLRARFLMRMGVPVNPNALRIWFSRNRS